MSASEHGAPQCRHEAGCITCSDQGIPMRVVDAGVGTGIATCVDAGGARSDILIGLVSPVSVGDMVLVHAGTALLRMDSHVGDIP